MEITTTAVPIDYWLIYVDFLELNPYKGNLLPLILNCANEETLIFCEGDIIML